MSDVFSLSQLGTVEGKVSRVVVGTPSTKQLAIEWLKEHPEHRKKSTRWLEEHARPMGVKIGKSTWSRAKK